MNAHRIMAIELSKGLRNQHEFVAAVHTAADPSSSDRRWTARMLLDAMNSAVRFYTEAPNGRRARVQRYTCGRCHREHVRTHLGDESIHRLSMLPHV